MSIKSPLLRSCITKYMWGTAYGAAATYQIADQGVKDGIFPKATTGFWEVSPGLEWLWAAVLVFMAAFFCIQGRRERQGLDKHWSE